MENKNQQKAMKGWCNVIVQDLDKGKIIEARNNYDFLLNFNFPEPEYSQTRPSLYRVRDGINNIYSEFKILLDPGFEVLDDSFSNNVNLRIRQETQGLANLLREIPLVFFEVVPSIRRLMRKIYNNPFEIVSDFSNLGKYRKGFEKFYEDYIEFSRKSSIGKQISCFDEFTENIGTIFEPPLGPIKISGVKK